MHSVYQEVPHRWDMAVMTGMCNRLEEVSEQGAVLGFSKSCKRAATVDRVIVTQTNHDEPPLALHVKFTQCDWSAWLSCGQRFEVQLQGCAKSPYGATACQVYACTHLHVILCTIFWHNVWMTSLWHMSGQSSRTHEWTVPWWHTMKRTPYLSSMLWEVQYPSVTHCAEGQSALTMPTASVILAT